MISSLLLPDEIAGTSRLIFSHTVRAVLTSCQQYSYVNHVLEMSHIHSLFSSNMLLHLHSHQLYPMLPSRHENRICSSAVHEHLYVR